MGRHPNVTEELCAVCETTRHIKDMKENYRGMMECPECGTELVKNQAHSGPVKRDQF